jgi:hypothetical protein
MNSSRLGQANGRQKLILPGKPKEQARSPQTGEVGLDQLVPLLLGTGARPSFAIQFNADQQIVRLVAQLGPVGIPLDFPANKVDAFIDQVRIALARCKNTVEDEPIELRPELAELLEQAQARITPAEAVTDSPE